MKKKSAFCIFFGNKQSERLGWQAADRLAPIVVVGGWSHHKMGKKREDGPPIHLRSGLGTTKKIIVVAKGLPPHALIIARMASESVSLSRRTVELKCVQLGEESKHKHEHLINLKSDCPHMSGTSWICENQWISKRNHSRVKGLGNKFLMQRFHPPTPTVNTINQPTQQMDKKFGQHSVF